MLEFFTNEYHFLHMVRSIQTNKLRKKVVCTIYIMSYFEIISDLTLIGPQVKLSYASLSEVLPAIIYFNIYIKLGEVLYKSGLIWRRHYLKMRLENVELMTLKVSSTFQ